MKIPKGMTEREVVDQIEVVCNRIAPKYTFYGYTAEDLKQEAFIICMEALNRYDEKRPLENFLSVNLSNRLKNFVRDHHFIKNDNGDRVKVLNPAQLEYENTIVDDDEKFATSYEDLETKTMVDMINDYIKGDFWQVDQNFLRERVVPLIRQNYITHDEFFEWYNEECR